MCLPNIGPTAPLALATKPNLNIKFCTLFDFCTLLKGGGCGGAKSFLGTDPVTANKLAKYPCLIFIHFIFFWGGGNILYLEIPNFV